MYPITNRKHHHQQQPKYVLYRKAKLKKENKQKSKKQRSLQRKTLPPFNSGCALNTGTGYVNTAACRAFMYCSCQPISEQYSATRTFQMYNLAWFVKIFKVVLSKNRLSILASICFTKVC